MLRAVPSDDRVFTYVLDGAATIGESAAKAGQVAWSDPIVGPNTTSTLELRATDPDVVTRVLLYGGRPIGEPVVLGGPFVMNTSEEIEAAYHDYRRGAFGDIPREVRLTRR